ncbi:MAG: NAD-dependent epimerase/dehydratase family protein, partial [Desulfobacterales bacterium]|nr:NAD-dependent epimerase/dehydratase family protein [Desulfobacterales bacterium]
MSEAAGHAPSAKEPHIDVLVTGVSGFVGSHLARALVELGHSVVGLARRGSASLPEHPQFRFVAADTARPGPWQRHAEEADTIVNLAGRSIFGRWSAAAKAEIRDSRILTTRNVVDAVP